MAERKLQLQFIFNEMDAKLQRKRELEAVVKDTRSNDAKYKALKDEQMEVQQRMKSRRMVIDADLQKEFEEIETIKQDIANLDVDMGQVALKDIQDGKPLVVKNRQGDEYEGELSVRWRKTGSSEAAGDEKGSAGK